MAADATPTAGGLGTGSFGAPLLRFPGRNRGEPEPDRVPGFFAAVGLCLLIPGFLLSGCSSRTAAVNDVGGSGSLRTYHDPENGRFRMGYPSNWHPRPSPGNRLLVQFEPGPRHAGTPAVCGVGSGLLPFPIPAEAIRVLGPMVAGPVRAAVEGLRPRRGDQARIGSHPAYRYEHTIVRAGGTLWVLQYLLIDGPRVYVLTCFCARSARDEHRGDFERMLGSFRPLPGTPSDRRAPRPGTPLPAPSAGAAGF